jgi:hypothetical protein
MPENVVKGNTKESDVFWDMTQCRLVCDYSLSAENIAAYLSETFGNHLPNNTAPWLRRRQYESHLCEGVTSHKEFAVISSYNRRSQWPQGLRHELSSPPRTLGSCVRIPLEACMCVFILFVLSYVQRAALRHADPPSKESYRLYKRSRNWKTAKAQQTAVEP